MKISTVAILGGGPAGCALAIHLARAGIRPILFDPGRRPELIVGESLIPSVIPHLRELGIESEVAQFSTFKPGAAFYLRPDDQTLITFADDRRSSPGYAYNVPRDLFDQTLLKAAQAAGAKLIKQSARLVASGRPEKPLLLTEESLAASGGALSDQPDLLIDATGRLRLSAKALGIGARRGQRNDTALFAHLSDVALEHPGHIHINRLKNGWSWRIPLPGRVSVGIVMRPERYQELGNNAEEQYHAVLNDDPILRSFASGSTRITPVMKYSNYQLISDNFSGKGWAAVGDAAGFVDPIFSSGLYLSLTGARALAQAVIAGGNSRVMAKYERQSKKRLQAWQQVAESFYSGRLFGLIRAAKFTDEIPVWNRLTPVVQKHLQRTLAGMVETESLSFQSARVMLRLNVGDRFGHRMRVK